VLHVRRSRSRWAGQALIWLALAVPLFVTMAGLAIDGAVLLTSRRELQSVADGAARAGATRLDMPRLRASGGADVRLDPTGATDAARGYLDQALATGAHPWQPLPQTTIQVGERRVHVAVHAQLQTAFLRIVSIDTVPVEASAFADLQYGIHNGSGG
jgi:uncharacterized membrane protein